MKKPIQPDDEQMEDDWQSLATWTYENSEWSSMLAHQKDHFEQQHARSLKRLLWSILGFVASGIILLCIFALIVGDTLSGIVLGLLVAGLGSAILYWHQAGEQKWATRSSQRMQQEVEANKSGRIEIASNGIKIGESFVHWGGDRRLRSISMINEPMKALRFDYDFLHDEHYSREFIWVPIPSGHEREAEAIARTVRDVQWP